MNYCVIPKTVSFDGNILSLRKAEISKYKEEAEILKKRAEKLLLCEPYSVVYKKLVPPTNDPHDYMTMGTYWWPDPEKEDGLPYIRRDGSFNPDATDRNKYRSMAIEAYELAVSAYLFERDDFAEKALELIKIWHLNEETKMNPHAEFAQAIPGICTGRGIGLIDFRDSYRLFDATEILKAIGALDEKTYNDIKEWYIEFINWMITSEKGIFEDNYFNNHGVWYDVQILSAAIFTSRPELAKRVAMNAYRKRHKTQIMKDGCQPHELERTNAMSYSSMNLLGLALIAKMSYTLGYKEYIQIDKDDGVFLLEKAVEFLIPYAKDQSKFPYQQIKPGDFGADICEVLNILFCLTKDEKYQKLSTTLESPKYLNNLLRL